MRLVELRAELCRLLVLFAGIAAIGGGAGAQDTRALKPVPFGCDGDTVTAIRIRSGIAPATGITRSGTVQAASRWLELSRSKTKDAVILAYMRLTTGELCTELDRRESERLLRAQTFIASASVRAVPDGPGRVHIEVDVVDEFPLLVAARVRRGTISSALLGSQNVAGRGITLAASGERGFAYRDGFGVRFVQYGLLGAPAFAAVTAERRAVIGERVGFEVAAPFLTDLQVRAFHSSAGLESGYSGLVRPDGDAASVFYRKTAYDVGWVSRIGTARGRGTVGFVGAALIGEDIRSGDDLVVVSDTGLVPVPGKPFGTSYQDFAITRVAAIGGLRTVRFITVRGFDALTAAQDMGTGAQIGLLIGPSIEASGPSGNVLVATDVYAGFGNARSFVAARAVLEARNDRDTHSWDAIVGTARFVWHARTGDARTHSATVEWSTVRQPVYPLQLTLRDPDSGVPGYGNSRFAGGSRVVAKVEERLMLPSMTRRADFALTAFASAGKLWADDVPFGRATGVEASAGVSLLGAFPAGSRRTYRMDLAFPFNPDGAGTHVELRFSVTDRARMFWLEPRDVARARTGAVPVSLMRW